MADPSRYGSIRLHLRQSRFTGVFLPFSTGIDGLNAYRFRVSLARYAGISEVLLES